MKRIIMHWTAGSHNVNNTDREHYHFIIDGSGRVVEGRHKPEANRKPARGAYAAHTLNANTGSIGVAVAAMHNAQERPFDAGKYPITEAQVTALVKLCAKLSDQYEIPVTRETILSHAEVQPTLRITQRGKWDIAWIPGMAKPGDPVAVGDRLRRDIVAALRNGWVAPEDVTSAPAPVTPRKEGWLDTFIRVILGLIRRK